VRITSNFVKLSLGKCVKEDTAVGSFPIDARNTATLLKINDGD
jgi:hypothetical protein